VKNIFFMVGRIDAEEEELETQSLELHGDPATLPQVNEEFLQSIDDAEIRDAFKKLLKSFARRKPKI